jgi:hypothetical protein
VWDSGQSLLPTKTSRFAYMLVEGSLSCINGGEIGVRARHVLLMGGVAVFGCLWLCKVLCTCHEFFAVSC